MYQDEENEIDLTDGSNDREAFDGEQMEQDGRKRFRIKKFKRRKKNLTIRDRIIYYSILFIGIALAVLLTWYILDAISNPNITSGIVRE